MRCLNQLPSNMSSLSSGDCTNVMALTIELDDFDIELVGVVNISNYFELSWMGWYGIGWNGTGLLWHTCVVY